MADNLVVGTAFHVLTNGLVSNYSVYTFSPTDSQLMNYSQLQPVPSKMNFLSF